jgi:formate hydrogenlyase transcriptional activator
VLGVIRTMPVDGCLLAATNRHLTRMVKHGEFRSDLYCRLKVFPITVPPLGERPGGIPILVRNILTRALAGTAATLNGEHASESTTIR